MTTSLDYLEWQATLFAERLNRFQLMRLGARANEAASRLLVLRNHAFEVAASALPPFLAYAGLQLRPEYSDYDDSLALPDGPAAAVLVWLDFNRLNRLDDLELVQWFTTRLDQIRRQTDAPLVVANAPDGGPRSEALNAAVDRWAASTPRVAVLELSRLAERLGAEFFDPARALATGTRFSDQGCLQAARVLGMEVLPEFLAPPLKAIAVDLDNTLYRGVLGEDGINGVELTPGHAALQRELARWAERGLLIAVISRNDARDVEQLFAGRGDFPLRPEMVASWRVGWSDKSSSIGAAAAAMNIATDAFLFIDDNAGELIEVARRIPGIRLLFAGPSAEDAARALALYPSLPRSAVTFAGRAADLHANREREVLAQSAEDEADYLQSLRPVLTFALDPAQDRKRLVELSTKTNQFNLALRRLDELEVGRYLTDPARAVVHVRLADRLADSGSVAAIFMHREAELLVVDELCISCRALGRKLENLIIAAAVRRGQVKLGAKEIAFAYTHGPRNGPAREWLQAVAQGPLPPQKGTARVSPEFAQMADHGAVCSIWADGATAIDRPQSEVRDG